MKSKLDVKGGLWFGDQRIVECQYNVGFGGLCEGLRGKRLLGLVKIKWPIICFLPLFKLHFVYKFVIHEVLLCVLNGSQEKKSREQLNTPFSSSQKICF